jgi:hypothetical protein
VLEPPPDVVIDVLVVPPVEELDPAEPARPPVLAFTHRPDRQVRPLSQAPPAVQAHPSAPNGQSLDDVEDEQAAQRKLIAMAAKPPRKTCLPRICQLLPKMVA